MIKITKRIQMFLLSTFCMLGSLSAASTVAIQSITDADAFPIVSEEGSIATIVYDTDDAVVVATVAQCLSDDINLITGKAPALSNSLVGIEYPIIAGTLGQSKFVDSLLASGGDRCLRGSG